jgi:hypothetical protein
MNKRLEFYPWADHGFSMWMSIDFMLAVDVNFIFLQRIFLSKKVWIVTCVKNIHSIFKFLLLPDSCRDIDFLL